MKSKTKVFFSTRFFLYSFVVTLSISALLLALLKIAGYPWNLMRHQVAIEPMEQPFRPLPKTAISFLEKGAPQDGFRVQSFSKEVVLKEGAALYKSYCLFCHGKEGKGDGPVAAKLQQEPMNLNSFAVQLMAKESLHRLIAHPKAIMPPFFHRLTEEDRQILTLFILEAFQPKKPPLFRQKGDLTEKQRGKLIYKELSCDRCHGKKRHKITPGIPPSLAFAGNKYQKNWLIRYLQNPYVRRFEDDGIRSELRMPKFQLKEGEISSLAEYLLTKRQDHRFEDPGIDWSRKTSEQILQGKKLFLQYNCNGCHTIQGRGGEVGPDLSGVGLRLKGNYIYNFIRDPKGFIPKTRMKDNDLWENEAIAITFFLMSQQE